MTNYLRALYYLYRMLRRAYWPQDKLVAYQNKNLRRIVEHAYESVPLYHQKFSEAGIKPRDIKTVEDLDKVPIVQKNEMRQRFHEAISKEFDVGHLKELHTSGSTGKPLFFYVSQAEDEFRKAKHLRANISCGQKPGDNWVTITSPLHFAETTRLQRALGIYASTPVSVFDDISTQVSVIEKLRPDVLDGYSNSLLLLAKEVEKRGIETIRPRFVIGGAELIDPSSREYIEQVFHVPFYDQYATVEMERMAWQCPEKTGYHIDADSVVMQFVDAEGEAVAPGERGETVCTSLFNYAMPFIRYAVGDICVAADDPECACGRTFPLMKIVEGRTDSLVVLPGGFALAPFAFIAAMMTFKFYDSIELFRVIQRREDLLVFKLLMKQQEVNMRVVEQELLAHLRSVLNLQSSNVAFEVEFVDDIPLDNTGKFSIVVSELN